MALASIELQRARRRLDDFCRRHSQALNTAPEWSFSQEGNRFELRVQSAPVLRMYYEQGIWHLSVPRADGGWLAYPPRPQLEGIDAVIEELEQAPLHVHW